MWRSPHLFIIQCAGDPSVSTACEMVCSTVLKVLNLYVVLFHLSITLLSVLCARAHTLSGSNSFLNRWRIQSDSRFMAHSKHGFGCASLKHTTIFYRYFRQDFFSFFKGQGRCKQPRVGHSWTRRWIDLILTVKGHRNVAAHECNIFEKKKKSFAS